VNARQIRTHLTWNQQNQKGNMTVAELCQTWNCIGKIPISSHFFCFTQRQEKSQVQWTIVSDPDRLAGTGVHSLTAKRSCCPVYTGEYIYTAHYLRHKPKWIGVTRCVLWVKSEKEKALYTHFASLYPHTSRELFAFLLLFRAFLLRSLPFSPKNVKQGLSSSTVCLFLSLSLSLAFFKKIYFTGKIKTTLPKWER
jgi:hypothetical protein